MGRGRVTRNSMPAASSRRRVASSSRLVVVVLGMEVLDHDRAVGGSEWLMSLLVAAYVFFGLPRVAPDFWAMVDRGLSSGVRWPGLLMLAALVLEAVGVWWQARSLPPAVSRGGVVAVLAGAMRAVVMLSRWMVGLMMLILGLLGLGIDVRGATGGIAVAMVLGLSIAREVVIYRWAFRPAEPAREERSPLGAKLLSLPLRLVLLTFIERGLFVDLAKTASRDIAAASPMAALAMVVGFGLVLAALYGIIVVLPIRAIELIRMRREGRSWAWLPSFLLEVVAIELDLLT